MLNVEGYRRASAKAISKQVKRQMWRIVEKEHRVMGFHYWVEAADRVSYRSIVLGPVLHMERKT